MKLRPVVIVALMTLAPGCRHGQSPIEPVTSATVVYIAKRVRTQDASRPLAQAVAVSDGKVLAVGWRDDVLDTAGSAAQVVELDGVIVPGLADAHGHLAGLGRTLAITGLQKTNGPEDIVARLKAAKPESFQGDWLLGRGWDQNAWPKGGAFPDRTALDAAFPSVPVLLWRVDHHAAWVNGEALRRAGITRETEDPPGGRILRDAQGEPTGVLIDNAMELVASKLPELTLQQLQKRLVTALRTLASVGLTSFHDAGMDLRTFEQLQRWDAIGALPLRVYAMAEGQGPDAQAFFDRGLFKGRMLELRAVKLLADGALGSRGAALHAPYSDDPANEGLLLLSPEDLFAASKMFMAAGFQVCVHAIGDRANALVLDVLDRAMTELGAKDGRHRVEHAQVLSPRDVVRFAKMGVIASMQPSHATSDMTWAQARLGPERVAFAYAWRSVLDSGATLAFGSDFPIEAPDPLLGLYAARTRQDAHGRPGGGWHPEQRLSGEEALHAFTTGPAYASFAEKDRGVLKFGMDADFTVVSVDPVGDDAKALLGAKVLLTVVGGTIVHDGR